MASTKNITGNNRTSSSNQKAMKAGGKDDDIPSNLMKFDVVIVGAGVAGVSAAYHLHQLSSSSSSSSPRRKKSKGKTNQNWVKNKVYC